jgi:hypothetical protein
VKGEGLEASHVYKWLYFYQLFASYSFYFGRIYLAIA